MNKSFNKGYNAGVKEWFTTAYGVDIDSVIGETGGSYSSKARKEYRFKEFIRFLIGEGETTITQENLRSYRDYVLSLTATSPSSRVSMYSSVSSTLKTMFSMGLLKEDLTKDVSGIIRMLR